MATQPLLLKRRGAPPQFSAHFYCGQTAGCIKMPFGMEVDLSPGDFVLDGDPATTPLKGHSPSPQFSDNVRCGQTTEWTKMPLGMEVGLQGPDDFVFDRDPATPRKRAHPHPIFGPCLLWPNGGMDQGATWYGDKPQCRRRCVRWGRSSPLKGAKNSPAVFGSCLLWPNSWMDEDTTWYGSRPRPRPHCVRLGPSYPRKGHSSPLFSAHVYCRHGRPSQLLLSSCLQSSRQRVAILYNGPPLPPYNYPFPWGI